MTLDVHQFAVVVSWIVIAIGFGLWLMWFFEKNPLRRLRMTDCGTVLVFSAVLLRYAGLQRPMGVVDWALAILSPLFIAAALWRLARTACPDDVRRGNQ